MPSDKSSRPSPVEQAVESGSRSADGPAAGNALNAWSSLIEDWWRTQSESIPAEFRGTMETSLNQSRAMIAMAACLSDAASAKVGNGHSADALREAATGLWQPVLEAFRSCEASLLGAPPASLDDEDYAAASGAYLGEFARLNLELNQRLQRILADIDSETGFVELQRRMLKEAEDAYLSHVSTEAFARRQAEFINALLRAVQTARRGEIASGRE